METIELGDISIAVDQKAIQNIHLSVYPPDGRVHISAPAKMELDTIRVFAISKLDWIKKQREELQSQVRETPREFINRESHYFLGERYLMKIVERNAPPEVELTHKYMILKVRPNTATIKRKEILDEWYRAQLKEIVPELIAKWEEVIGVECQDFGIKRMRTKWGSCKREAGRIWLNLELARKPVECLEYIIVHELTHFHERNHTARFQALMDQFMPQWRHHRDTLNRLPFSHLDWGY
ncbi:M48 family metallopeptidase [Marinoscillum sp.]|uniref:M48 family metallopeptidase n=1 Tax=Marinoscillum sp. TaxID=2024838 RepID=UPI003BAB04DB